MVTFGAIMAASALTYPIYFFEARNLWLFSINVCLGKRQIMEKEIPTTTLIETRKDDVLMEPFRVDEYITSFMLFAVTIVAAFFLSEDFGLITSLNGATAGTTMGLILPGVFYCVTYCKIGKKVECEDDDDGEDYIEDD